MSWHAVDASGRDLATGRPPLGVGRSTPAAAVAAAPVAAWPLAVVGGDGRRLSLAGALGAGGARVEVLLDALAKAADDDGSDDDVAKAGADDDGSDDDVETLARATPAGTVHLPLAVVDLGAGVEAAARVDLDWLAVMDRRRAGARRALLAAGRGGELEAALHVAVLVATERLDPAGDADVEAHVASGARLWLLAGAVVSALVGTTPDPFAPWARLVTAGWWPVGPSGGRLVVSAPGRTAAPGHGRRSG